MPNGHRVNLPVLRTCSSEAAAVSGRIVGAIEGVSLRRTGRGGSHTLWPLA